jgi:hypothetical protein
VPGASSSAASIEGSRENDLPGEAAKVAFPRLPRVGTREEVPGSPPYQLMSPRRRPPPRDDVVPARIILRHGALFMHFSTLLRAGVLASGCLFALSSSGCAASTDEELGEISQDVKKAKHLVQPQGVYFADVTANGTGCPAGTWDVAVSADGETFTARFNAFEVQMEPGQPSAMKDCQLDIKLGSAEGLSYSVASFYYQGYAFLEKDGMQARHTAAYFFKGNKENKADGNQMLGPFDDSYLFADEVGPSRRVWSKCKRDETLHVKTALLLQNDGERTGAGYVNNTTVDASLSFNWKLQFKRCH